MTDGRPDPDRLTAAFHAALATALEGTGFRLEPGGPGAPGRAQAIASHPASPASYRIALDPEVARPSDDIGLCGDDAPTGRVLLSVVASVPGQALDQFAGLWLAPPLADDHAALAAITASTVTAHHGQPLPGTRHHLRR